MQQTEILTHAIYSSKKAFGRTVKKKCLVIEIGTAGEPAELL
jgi:hypothetical protein